MRSKVGQPSELQSKIKPERQEKLIKKQKLARKKFVYEKKSIQIFHLKTAIVLVDQKHSDLKKRLNALKHENVAKQKQLEELQTRYDQMVKDADEAVKTDAGESETAVVINTFCFMLIFCSYIN